MYVGENNLVFDLLTKKCEDRPYNEILASFQTGEKFCDTLQLIRDLTKRIREHLPGVGVNNLINIISYCR